MRKINDSHLDLDFLNRIPIFQSSGSAPQYQLYGLLRKYCVIRLFITINIYIRKTQLMRNNTN